MLKRVRNFLYWTYRRRHMKTSLAASTGSCPQQCYLVPTPSTAIDGLRPCSLIDDGSNPPVAPSSFKEPDSSLSIRERFVQDQDLDRCFVAEVGISQTVSQLHRDAQLYFRHRTHVMSSAVSRRMVLLYPVEVQSIHELLMFSIRRY